LDLASAMWELPASRIEDEKRRTKNRDEHRVPLSPLAMSLIKEALALAPNSAWLFPNPSGTGPIDGHAASTAMIRSKATFGIENFRVHDLRRTCATGMGDLGIADDTISRVLNHRRSDVTRKHYNKSQHDAQKRQALEAWAMRLEEIIGMRQPVSNVVSLPSR
jgi:integrase